MSGHPIKSWHAYIERHDGVGLDELLAEDAVFESPVVFTPQRGKPIVMAYLKAAANVLGDANFRYTGEWLSEDGAVLEFENEIDGIKINGVDIVRWNAEGKISHFKVMVRPLQAVNLLHRLMGETLAKMKG